MLRNYGGQAMYVQPERRKMPIIAFAALTISVPHALVKLDIVGREKTRLAAVVAEPPVIVREFLQVKVSDIKTRVGVIS